MKTKDFIEKLVSDYNSLNSGEKNATLSFTPFGNIIVKDFIFDKSDLTGLLMCPDFLMIHPQDSNSLYISIE